MAENTENGKTNDKQDWVTFNMKLRPSMTDVLDAEAEELGISRASLIRVIISQYQSNK